LGFTNFYHIFIKDYSKDCCPIDMTYKQGQIQMGQKCYENFQIVENDFITTSIIIHTNKSNSFLFEAYASNFALGAMLS
jgi:hypothetical protein